MNNLEWVDKQILLVKENIQYHKDLLAEYLLAESEEEYTNEIISAIKLLEPELQTLQQIKAKLEAWEVVKRKGFIFTKEEKSILIGTWNIYRLSSRELNNKEYETLKKALEVKEND